MKTVVHITGTSSGLGKALAEYYSKLENTTVHGYSRREGPSLPNYIHHSVDLSTANSELQLATSDHVEREILINNAGSIGPVNPIGKLESSAISNLFELNVSTVMKWTNQFVRESTANHKVVISISSGAGKYPVISWGAYCASKAAVNSMTEVWNVDRPDIHFLSIAPGVVDTEMQAAIRNTSEEDFPDKQRFVSLKEDEQLKSPKEVAELIAPFGIWPHKAPSNVFSVRDL